MIILEYITLARLNELVCCYFKTECHKLPVGMEVIAESNE